MKKYYSRISDEKLSYELEAVGAIVVEGPKWCGKTTTAKQIAKSILNLADPQVRRINEIRIQTDPSSLLKGETPRLIDEWQVFSDTLWDMVRYEVDKRDEFGQFILTGSVSPVKRDVNTHSGTGRIKRLYMRTMSLYESTDSTGDVSIKSLFAGDEAVISGDSSMTLDDLIYLVSRGGWPKAVATDNKNIALRQAKNYYQATVHQEQTDDEGNRLSEEWISAVLKAYARSTGTPASIPSLLKDCRVHGGYTFSDKTLQNYIAYLKRIFLFEDMVAWNPNLRSKTAIRTTPVRYFTDPSIAVCALGASGNMLSADLETFGLLFENLAVRDLRIYAESLGGTVYHYRDKNGLECDAVIVLPDGRYGLFEIKLGGETLIEEGARSLNRLEKILDTDKMGKPTCKSVICGISPYAYKRPDGVSVIPIDCLGPA